MRNIKPVNSAGVKFVKFIGIDSNGNKKYLCQCPRCDKPFEMWASHYYRGSNSCECEFYGKQYPRLYSIWTNMKSRCYNYNFPEYKYYGNRGIKICKAWKNNFYEFLQWALANGYQDNLTIDRIDVNGNYEPNNCRWADAETQANNKQNTLRVPFENNMSLHQVCRKYGFNYKTETTYYYRHGYEAMLKRLEEKILDTRKIHTTN